VQATKQRGFYGPWPICDAQEISFHCLVMQETDAEPPSIDTLIGLEWGGPIQDREMRGGKSRKFFYTSRPSSQLEYYASQAPARTPFVSYSHGPWPRKSDIVATATAWTRLAYKLEQECWDLDGYYLNYTDFSQKGSFVFGRFLGP
jgi:hypothetical protein